MLKNINAIATIFLLFYNCCSVCAHSSFELHKKDFYSVLSFNEDKQLTDWMKLISSKLIDNHKGEPRNEYNGLCFYDYLKQQYPPFKCKHRLLFHWGYNARPWSEDLDRKMEQCKFDPATIKSFQQTLIKEQKYRNGKANVATEALLGFSSSGKDASYANAFVSLVYDIHIIGDYTPDNKDMDGVAPLTSAVGDIINSLRRIDSECSKELIKEILVASKRTDIGVQQRAEFILTTLTKGFKKFILKADNGNLAKRLAKRGFTFQQ